MDNIQMLDAVERYIRGEMDSQERVYFEQLRKTNPEVDQLVVEHTIFLNQMQKFGEHKQFKASLHEVHNSLFEAGVIKEEVPKTKVIDLFRRHKKMLGVAASIAGFIAIAISGMVSYKSHQDTEAKVQQLKRYFDNNLAAKTAQVRNEMEARIGKAPENTPVKSGGTSFLIDGKGLLVTNAHVVKDATSLIVQNTKTQEFRARTIYVNPVTDLAILQIVDNDFKPIGSLPYGIRKSSASLGEPLFTLGFPRDEIVYNEGYMSAKTGFKGDTLTCQIGVAANPGNSGGPVFNKYGEVIGIINTRETKAEGVVFAVTAKNLFTSLEELKKDTAYQHIKLPTSSSVRNLDRPSQVTKIEECIFMVKSY
ncbi:MAG TPA: serine protease [Chitinophagaceae bacterium]|nr:serine protease [Chitinophagaceae bacterium]